MICKACNTAIENKDENHSGHIYKAIYIKEGKFQKLKCQCDKCNVGTHIEFKEVYVP